MSLATCMIKCVLHCVPTWHCALDLIALNFQGALFTRMVWYKYFAGILSVTQGFLIAVLKVWKTFH